jgi:hypothetical protein
MRSGDASPIARNCTERSPRQHAQEQSHHDQGYDLVNGHASESLMTPPGRLDTGGRYGDSATSCANWLFIFSPHANAPTAYRGGYGHDRLGDHSEYRKPRKAHHSAPSFRRPRSIVPFSACGVPSRRIERAAALARVLSSVPHEVAIAPKTVRWELCPTPPCAAERTDWVNIGSRSYPLLYAPGCRQACASGRTRRLLAAGSGRRTAAISHGVQ